MSSNRQKLFDYWQEIPSFIFKEIPKEKYFSHPVRREIIRFLKLGVEEKSPDGKYNTRHALNVREISNKLKKSNGKPIGTTAIYFHLDMLSELGLIQEVITLHEGPHGRNLTKYFGRVARNLVLSNIDEECDNFKRQFDEFRKFAKLTNIKLPNDFDKKAKQYNDLKQKYNQILGKWLVDHEELILQENLNLNLLFEFIKNVNTINPEFISFFNELLTILQGRIDYAIESHF
ncbi:MAG: winged helix-turn-helix transcriptional regulator [Asgard group archaeon]|nr:winged helix-turn-helix transcriptional regulator [Asgard group archaeon]